MTHAREMLDTYPGRVALVASKDTYADALE
jgi:hypothetical protein